MAFGDPDVLAVLDAYRACAGGMGVTPALLLQGNPPQIVYQGLLHYVHVLDRVADHERKKAEKERKGRK